MSSAENPNNAGTTANLQKDPVTGEMISKTVLKRREKQRAKEASKAAKAPAPQEKKEKTDTKSSRANEEELNPNGTKLEGVTESLSGRIHNIRASGSKLVFYDLHAEGSKVQIMATLQGEVVGVTGNPSRTKLGELSITASTMSDLARNLHQIPSSHFGLKDQETRYRKRYLVFIISENTRHIFITRSKIINYILKVPPMNMGFMEVEKTRDNIACWWCRSQAFYHTS
ncbi:hypothetical protein MPER_08028 [Moniliophthora perniciosa FA553]|nr:hypothetical protein MPER_08028 [Moniliophthora perniciosa FA553]